MLGYVVVNRDQLTPEEFRTYNGYYCGVCKSIARGHGQLPRLVLSYDIVFLAMVLSSLREGESIIWDEHCIIHPIDKKPVVTGDPTLDYAADMLLILSYHKFLDDVKDEGSLKGKIGVKALKNTYSDLKKNYPEICDEVEQGIKRLSLLEKQKSGSLDETSQAFGDVMKAIFSGYSQDSSTKRILGELGDHLGKWIYIMDAIDDYQSDLKENNYNPFKYRERGMEGIEDLLFFHLGHVSMATDLMDIKKNKGIIDNVIMLGLRGRTEGLLKKVKAETNG